MQQPVSTPPARRRPAASAAPRAARRFSRPELRYDLHIHSEHGQRLLRRALRRTATALYGLEVVLYALNENQDAVEALEEAIDATLERLTEALDAALDKYRLLLETNEGMPEPRYRNPLNATLVIASPRMMTYAILLERYDELVRIIDRLWFGQVVKNREHANVIYALRTAFFDAGNSFARLEEGARRAALRGGQLDADDDDSRADPVVTLDDDDESPPADARTFRS